MNKFIFYLQRFTDYTIKYTTTGNNNEQTKTINDDAITALFKDNTTLATVTIPEGVTSIGTWAFQNCSALTSAKFKSENLPTLLGGNIFNGCTNLKKIYVTNELVFAYKTAEYFSDYADKITELNFWTVSNGVATYGEKGEKPFITVKGLSNSATTSDLNLSGNVVTISANALDNKNVSVTGNYTLALAKGISAPKYTSAHWNVANGTAKYQSASNTAGYTLANDKKSVTYTAAVTEKNLATITGLKLTATTSDFSLKKNVITLKSSALDGKNISVTGNYTLALANGISAPKTTAERPQLTNLKKFQQVILCRAIKNLSATRRRAAEIL